MGRTDLYRTTSNDDDPYNSRTMMYAMKPLTPCVLPDRPGMVELIRKHYIDKVPGLESNSLRRKAERVLELMAQYVSNIALFAFAFN